MKKVSSNYLRSTFHLNDDVSLKIFMRKILQYNYCKIKKKHLTTFIK